MHDILLAPYTFYMSKHHSKTRLTLNSFEILHNEQYTVKKRLSFFPSAAGMSLIKHFLARNNLIIPGQGEFGQ
jgi:hypothetical protein